MIIEVVVTTNKWDKPSGFSVHATGIQSLKEFEELIQALHAYQHRSDLVTLFHTISNENNCNNTDSEKTPAETSQQNTCNAVIKPFS